MGLGVQSTPELYGMLLGWFYYDQAWLVLVNTGVVLLPFIGLIAKNSLALLKNEPLAMAAQSSLRRLEFELVSMLLVILLAAQPMILLSPKVVHHQGSCQTITQIADHTKTTYDQAIRLPTNVRVPLVWYAVMAVSEGITAVLIQNLGCLPDLRGIMTEVRMTPIGDPVLQKSVHQFYQQCFLPTRYQWLQHSHPTVEEDTNWLGSKIYLNTPGFYDQHFATQAVKGFPFHPDRDWTDAQGDLKPLWGRPRCDQWWQAPRIGLRDQLIHVLPLHFWQRFHSLLSTDYEEAVIKALLVQSVHHWDYQGANHLVGHWGYSHAAEALGAEMSRFKSYPKLYAIEQAAPMIRALLLLAMYAFLPFMLVFSGYQIKSVVMGSIFLFSVIFFSAIWHLIEGVDDALIRALYKNHLFAQTPQAILADTVIGLMMVMMPLFWFTVMGVFGVSVGSGMSREVSSVFSSTGKMGEEGGKILGSGVGEVAKQSVRSL